MPCGYNYNVYPFTRRPDGLWTWTATFKDNAFERRLRWIGNCASIGGGTLHHFDYIKANTSRYFFETKRVYIPRKYDWGWGIESVYLNIPTCYFLGSYPNYWNTQNRRIVFAHDLMTTECYSIGKKPEMEGEYFPDVDRQVLNDTADLYGTEKILDYFHPERVPQPKSIEEGEAQRKIRLEIETALADLTQFYNSFEMEQFMLQKPLLDARQKTYKDCVARTWPKRVKEYAPKQPPPTEPPPLTRVPMEEIRTPTPEVPPGIRHGPGEPLLRLTFNYGIKPYTLNNALELHIWLEEVL